LASLCGQKGGRRRARFNYEDLPELPAPSGIEDVRRILGTAMIELRSAKIEPKVAAALSSLASAYLDSEALLQFSRRLDELETAVHQEELPQLEGEVIT
jgi:hypothetical protein